MGGRLALGAARALSGGEKVDQRLQAADGLEARPRRRGTLAGALLAGGEVAGSSAHGRAAGGQAAGTAAVGSKKVLEHALKLVSPTAPSRYLPATAVHCHLQSLLAGHLLRKITGRKRKVSSRCDCSS
jgi:hypothetical protein